MTNAILAIDQGTTSSRAVVVDRSGEVISSAQEPIVCTFPRSGWVNQDAEALWDVTLGVARTAIARSGLAQKQIAGIGIANQRETSVIWDRATGAPVAPAIVWQSRQSAPQVAAIAERGMTETYQSITGLVPDAYFSATKIAWSFEQNPELRRRADAGELCFGTIDSWLMWNLSGGRVHATDVSNASRTMLFDIRQSKWSEPLLSDLRIPRPMMPEVMPNALIAFETDPALFGRPIPVAGFAGDQQAALFGQACFNPGEAKNTYGTGSFLLMNTGDQAIESHQKLLTTIAWDIGRGVQYALEGSIFVTGSAVQWLRDGLGIIQDSSEIAELAGSVPDSGGAVFVPALVGLGAPYWDHSARGAILGISRGTTSAHIARATLEAIAFQTRDVLDAMNMDSGIALKELRVDGGAANNDLLMQIQADVLGVPVVRPGVTETTAMGAAFLAGLATGVWANQDEIRAIWREDQRFEPDPNSVLRTAGYERWKEGVSRSLHWDRGSATK